MNCRLYIRIWLVLLSLFYLSSCDLGHNDTALGRKSNGSSAIDLAGCSTVETLAVSADVGWERVNANAETDTTTWNLNSSFATYVATAELQNQLRRQNGLEFWCNYPDDPRRYDWLLQTTYLAPVYPEDVAQWAISRSRPDSRPSALDLDLIANWNTTFEHLKSDFVKSEITTVEDIRSLEFGQIRAEIRRATQLAQREIQVDLAALFERISAFTREYHSPISESDRKHYVDAIAYLLSTLLAYDREFSIPEALKARLRNTFRESVSTEIEFQIISYRVQHGVRSFDFLTEEEFWNAFLGVSKLDKYTHSQVRWMAIGEPGARGILAPQSVRSLIQAVENERINRQYRNDGLLLWKSVPDPNEQFRWLYRTVNIEPHYVLPNTSAMLSFSHDILTMSGRDLVAYQEWQQQYRQLRMELATIGENSLTSDNWRHLDIVEVYSTLIRAQVGWPVDAEELLEKIGSLNEDIELLESSSKGFLYARIGQVITYQSLLGLDNERMLEFLESLVDSNDERVRSLAVGWIRRMTLNKEGAPIELSLPRLNGERFELASTRGNIVLLDFWATSCAACVDAMPRIDDVYETYNSIGLEIVAIVFDGTRNRDRVRRIIDQSDIAGWIVLDGEKDHARILSDLGIGSSVPQYMLLNRDGTLFASTGEVDMGRNFEALLEEMLAAEAAEQEAAAVH